MVLQKRTSGPPKGGRGSLFVVSWNVGIGSGRVESLVRSLVDEEHRANRAEPDFILLLQEALRSETPTTGERAADRLQAAGKRDDVLSLAMRLGMDLAYVPSMPNGEGKEDGAREDRGNAILSTLPLRDVTAIELPLVRQRRVAVVAGVDVDGSPLTVISVHLETRGTLLHGSIFSGPISRERQAAALVQAVPTQTIGPVVVGGDFNTVAGAREPAIRRMEAQFARIECGSPITQEWGFALDYVFASEPSMLEGCRRVNERYGSDHHPLVARVSRPSHRGMSP